MRNDSEMAKKMDQVIAQLAQRGRGVGVHLILSTSAIRRDVIPPVMRSQIPARIAFLQFDANASRLLLDQDGAENLSRNGEMLYRDRTGTIHRFQTYYLSEEEPYFS